MLGALAGFLFADVILGISAWQIHQEQSHPVFTADPVWACSQHAFYTDPQTNQVIYDERLCPTP